MKDGKQIILVVVLTWIAILIMAFGYIEIFGNPLINVTPMF